MSTTLVDNIKKVQAIRDAVPAEGLFAEKEWLVSPEPYLITDEFAEDLDKLGYRLHLFLKACNQLYFASVKGRQPTWIAELLDRGKPPELVEAARQFRAEIPQVIRPDLVLTPEGMTIAELDSVPGGIGLTAWFGGVYSDLGYDVLGGRHGMLDGFRSITPQGASIVISEESATYKPEMLWLARQLNERYNPSRWTVKQVDSRTTDLEITCRTAYRFFELFDLPNIPAAPRLMAAAGRGDLTVTPPFKPFLEEKLWFALFWLRPLRDFWRQELSERHFLQLQKVIPYTWLVDPAPLPPHAVLPGLEVQSWDEVAAFSQKQRELILKISGFSELAWGSRGVHVAQDLPQNEWREVLEHALAEYPEHPYLLQKFHKGRLVSQPYMDRTGSFRTMEGRVRLCPYYFIEEGKTKLRGALATICPADKKLLHGMSDAILVPTAVRG